MKQHSLLKNLVIVCLLIASWTHCKAAIGVGSRVRVNSGNGVNVRSTPAGTSLGTQPFGATGTAVGGPQNALFGGVNHTWWNVNFDSGTNGWVSSNGSAIVAVSNPAPSVSSVTPTTVVGSTSARTFTIYGSNFVSGCRVQAAWGNNGFTYQDVSATPVFTNSGQISVSINTATTPDTWRLRVRNSDGQTSSGFVTFTVTAPATPPNAPTNLEAQAFPDRVSLGWSDNSSNETGFRIERRIGSGGWDFLTNTSANSSNSAFFNDTSTQPRTSYSYRIFAFNNQGTSNASNIVTLTTPAGRPGPFTLSNDPPVWDAALSRPKVNLRWSASADVGNYAVHRVGATPQAGISGLSFTDSSGTVAGATYNYFVRASNAAGTTDSNTITVTMPNAPLVAPNAPTNLEAQAFPDRVSLGWLDNSSNETGFRIERRIGSGSWEFLTKTSANSSNSAFHNDNSTQPRTSYSYRIFAFNNQGTSSASNIVTLTTPAGKPGSFTLSNDPPVWDAALARPKVNLRWTASADVGNYAVHRVSATPQAGIGGLSFTDSSGTVAGATYSYFVRASNAAGTTDSNTITVTMPNAPVAPPPGIPALTFPGSSTSPGILYNTLAPSFMWSAAANATRYALTIAKHPFGSANVVYTNTNLTGTSFNLPAGSLQPGQSYSWTLSAFNASGQQSLASSPFYFQTQGTAAKPIVHQVSPNAVSGSSSARLFTLSGSGFVAGARIQAAWGNMNFVWLDTNANPTFVDSNTLTISINTGTTQDEWRLRVRNPDGQISDAFATFTVAAPTVGDPVLSGVNPNPVTGAPLPERVSIRLLGSNLQSGAEVFLKWTNTSSFQRLASEHVTWVNPGAIDARVATSSVRDDWRVYVRNPGGKISNTIDFVVNAPSTTLALDSVSPSSVAPGESPRTFTLTGTGFGTTDAVRISHGTTVVTLSAPNVQFQSSSRITFSHAFKTAPLSASVRVVKPGGAESQPRTVTVSSSLMPDLVCDPATITISPSTVMAGKEIRIEFTVRNTGNAPAPASLASVNLQESTSPQNNVNLSPARISVPPIDAGQSVTVPYLGIAPATTKPGSFKIRIEQNVLLNMIQESNTANNSAISTSSLVVTDTAAEPLEFEVQPTDRNVKEWQAISLSARATGAMEYQWFFNGYPTDWGLVTRSKTTGVARMSPNGTVLVDIPSAQLHHQGTYFVRAFGANRTHLDSRQIVVRVNSPSEQPLLELDRKRTKLTNLEANDPNPRPDFPTIVLTHGWQPPDISLDSSLEWVGWKLDRSYDSPSAGGLRDLGSKIKDRLRREGINNVNILLFSWEGAFRRSASNAELSIDDAGGRLADALLHRLTAEYDQPIHIIGHSFGCFVNAVALQNLSNKNYFRNLSRLIHGRKVQLTNIDPAFRAITNNIYIPLFDPRWNVSYYISVINGNTLINSVENYYSNRPSGTGRPIPGTGPVANGLNIGPEIPFGVDHTRAFSEWYPKSIAEPTFRGDQLVGFNTSIVLAKANGWGTLSKNFPWARSQVSSTVIVQNQSVPAAILSSGESGAAMGSGGASTPSISLFSSGGSNALSSDSLFGSVSTTNDLTLGIKGLSSKSDKGSLTSETSVPGFQSPEEHQMVLRGVFQMPSKASVIRIFGKRNQAEASGVVAVRFAGHPLTTVGLDYFDADAFTELRVPVHTWRGQLGTLEIWFQNDSDTESTFRVARIEILSDAEVTAKANSLAIAGPKDRSKTRNDRTVWTGRWRSKVKLESLTVSLNNQSPVPLSFDSAGRFSTEVGILMPGVNYVRFDATTAHRQVISEIREIQRLEWTDLNIAIQGEGTVKGARMGASKVEVGNSLRLTAAPKSGHVFERWSGDFEGRMPLALITLTQPQTITAHFIPSPFTASNGTYTQAFQSIDPMWSGSATLLFSKQGVFTGTIWLSGRQIRVSGVLDSEGKAIIFLPGVGAVLHLTLDASSEPPRLSMIVRHGGEDVATSGGSRAAIIEKGRRSDFEGRYTLAFEAPIATDTIPAMAHGHGTVTVNSKGRLAIAGLLPDATPIIQSIQLHPNGSWPLFVRTHRQRGWVAGRIALPDDLGTENIQGKLAWFKPDSSGTYLPSEFVGHLEVVGSKYLPLSSSDLPLSGLNHENNQIGMAWRGVLEDGELQATGSASSTKSIAFDIPEISLRFNSRTGQFDGRVPSKEGETNPIAETLKFSGVVLQDRSAGTALFRTLEGTGDVRVHSAAGSRPVSVSAISDPVGGGSVSGSGSYHLGKSVVLQATPSQGYEFEHWLEGARILSPNSSLKLSPLQDRNFIAKFKSVFVPFDETLTFDDNQIPQNWLLSFHHGGNGGVANQRFEARQVDTYAILSRILEVGPAASYIELKYRANATSNYWGAGTQVQFRTDGGTEYTAGFGKRGHGVDSSNVQIGRYPDSFQEIL